MRVSLRARTRGASSCRHDGAEKTPYQDKDRKEIVYPRAPGRGTI